MAVVATKMGGKRKVWYTRSTGRIGDGKPNAAIEVKAESGWNPGKTRPSKKFNYAT